MSDADCLSSSSSEIDSASQSEDDSFSGNICSEDDSDASSSLLATGLGSELPSNLPASNPFFTPSLFSRRVVVQPDSPVHELTPQNSCSDLKLLSAPPNSPLPGRPRSISVSSLSERPFLSRSSETALPAPPEAVIVQSALSASSPTTTQTPTPTPTPTQLQPTTPPASSGQSVPILTRSRSATVHEALPRRPVSPTIPLPNRTSSPPPTQLQRRSPLIGRRDLPHLQIPLPGPSATTTSSAMALISPRHRPELGKQSTAPALLVPELAESALAGRPMGLRTAQNREFVNRAEEERSKAEFRLQFLQKQLVDTHKELDKAKAEILELRKELQSDDHLVHVKSKEIQTQLKENLKRYRETQVVQEEKKIFETLLHQAQEELFNARLDSEKTVHGLKQAKQAVDDKNQQLLTRNVEVEAELEKKVAETVALTRALQSKSEAVEELSRLLEVEKRAREEAESINSLRGQVHDEMLGMFDPFSHDKSTDGLLQHVHPVGEVAAYHSLDSELLGLCDDFEGQSPRDFAAVWDRSNGSLDDTNFNNDQLAAEAQQLAAEVERLNAERQAIEEEQRLLQEQRATIEAEVERLIAKRLATESEHRKLEEQRLAIEADVDRLNMQRLNIEAARCEDEERLQARRLELQAEIEAAAAKCAAAEKVRKEKEAQLAADEREANRVAQELEELRRLRIATEAASAAEETLRAEAAARMREEQARSLQQMQEEQARSLQQMQEERAEYERARNALLDELCREKAQLQAESGQLEQIKAQRRTMESTRIAEQQRLQSELALAEELAQQRAQLLEASNPIEETLPIATEEPVVAAIEVMVESHVPQASVEEGTSLVEEVEAAVLDEEVVVGNSLTVVSTSVTAEPQSFENAAMQIAIALAQAVSYLEHRKTLLHHRKKSLVVPTLFISLEALIEWLR